MNYKNIIKSAKLQTIFSLGDETISEILKYYYLNGANYGALRRAQKELDFSIDGYFKKVMDGYCLWEI